MFLLASGRRYWLSWTCRLNPCLPCVCVCARASANVFVVRDFFGMAGHMESSVPAVSAACSAFPEPDRLRERERGRDECYVPHSSTTLPLSDPRLPLIS